jgi:hypothetical protein
LPGIGVGRIGGDELSIREFRFVQAADLVVLDGGLKVVIGGHL